MDSHEAHTPHVKHTGHKWLDLVLGGAALLISLISLYVAVHHGYTMEKLVAANSWPHLQFAAAVERGDAAFGPESVRLRLSIRNSGVGPARFETLELWNGDVQVLSADQLGKTLKAYGGGKSFNANVEGETALGQVIGSKERVDLLALTTADGTAWSRPFIQFGTAVKARMCFCSVFDECDRVDDREASSRPVRVETCLEPGKALQPDIGATVADVLSGGPTSQSLEQAPGTTPEPAMR